MPVSDLCCPLYTTTCVCACVCMLIHTYICMGVPDIQLNKRQWAVCRCANSEQKKEKCQQQQRQIWTWWKGTKLSHNVKGRIHITCSAFDGNTYVPSWGSASSLSSPALIWPTRTLQPWPWEAQKLISFILQQFNWNIAHPYWKIPLECSVRVFRQDTQKVKA